MRRLLKIATVVLLLSSLILGSLLVVLLNSSFLDEWARDKVIAALQRRYPIHVDLEALRLKLWEGTLELEGLDVSDLQDPESEPVIEVDFVRLGFSISRYLSPTLLVDRISLESPRVRLVQDRNGRLNLSNMLAATPPEPVPERAFLVRVEVEELSLENGLLVYQTQPFRLDSAEGSLSGTARFLPGGETTGHFALQSLDLVVAGFTFSQVAVSSDFRIRGQTVEISDFELSAPELSAKIAGQVEGWTELNAQFDVNASIELPERGKPNLSPDFQQGRIDFSGTLTGKPENLVLRGEMSSPRFRFQGVSFRDLHSEITLANDGLVLQKVRVGCLGGLIEAKGVLTWEDTRSSELALAGTAIGMRPFLSLLGWESAGVGGLADVRSQLTWPGLSWQELKGRGSTTYRGYFQTAAGETGEQGKTLPFEGRCDFISEKQVIQLSGGLLRTDQSNLAYSGQIDLGGFYDLNLDLVSGEGQELQGVAEANGLLPQETEEPYPFALRGRSIFKGSLSGSRDDFSVRGWAEAGQVDFRGHQLGTFSGKVVLGRDLVRLEEAEFRDPSYRLGFSLIVPVESEDLGPKEVDESGVSRV